MFWGMKEDFVDIFWGNHERTSDSLNEGLPIKMVKEKFQRN